MLKNDVSKRFATCNSLEHVPKTSKKQMDVVVVVL